MIFKIIKEAYLDDEELFYDYHTETVDSNDIFDASKTGMSYDVKQQYELLQDEIL